MNARENINQKFATNFSDRMKDTKIRNILVVTEAGQNIKSYYLVMWPMTHNI